MKHLATVFAISATVLLFGCGGAPPPPPANPTSPTPPTTPATPPPPPVTPHIAGDWQFSATSSVPGGPSLTFAGNINQVFASNGGQPDSTVTGAFHVDGSSCFDRLIPLALTGPVNAGGDTSLSFATTNGQVITLTGSFYYLTFKGAYRIDGGCAGGDQGNVTGYGANLNDQSNGTFTGTFTDSMQKTFNAKGDITQDASASAQGSFALNGDATFDTPCFAKGGTLTPGVFPSGSFLLGTLVSLEMDTGNGTLTFVGTWDLNTNQISGSYSVSGGSCDGSGNAVLQLNGYWDY